MQSYFCIASVGIGMLKYQNCLMKSYYTSTDMNNITNIATAKLTDDAVAATKAAKLATKAPKKPAPYRMTPKRMQQALRSPFLTAE